MKVSIAFGGLKKNRAASASASILGTSSIVPLASASS